MATCLADQLASTACFTFDTLGARRSTLGERSETRRVMRALLSRHPTQRTLSVSVRGLVLVLVLGLNINLCLDSDPCHTFVC